MPEMHFTVRWPDTTVDDCYSPSLVIKDYLNVGEHYSVSDFVERSRTALDIAS
ncbi:MAG: MSMEG_0570 family nitrogen starvation response protein, partial [Telluria sp.]